MKTLLVILSLFVLSGCESIEWTSVSVGTGYSSYHPHNYINYTLGYYSGSHYNGYSVYGSHGHRYYYAPRNYSHHRHFRSAPVVHRHVHTSYCEHNYVPRRQVRNNYIPPQPRHTPRQQTPPRVVPRANPRQQTPPREREHRSDRRQEREPKNNRERNQRRH